MYPHVWDNASKSISRDIELVAGMFALGFTVLGGLIAVGVRAAWDTRHRHKQS